MGDVVIAGVGPDASLTTNAQGGTQSLKRWRFDLVDASSLFVLGRVLDHGARKYGANNWRKIATDDHLNSVLMHIYAYLAGDRTDDHLGHAFCRTMFALAVALTDGYEARQADD